MVAKAVIRSSNQLASLQAIAAVFVVAWFWIAVCIDVFVWFLFVLNVQWGTSYFESMQMQS